MLWAVNGLSLSLSCPFGGTTTFIPSLFYLSRSSLKGYLNGVRDVELTLRARALQTGAHTHAHGFWVGMGAILLVM